MATLAATATLLATTSCTTAEGPDDSPRELVIAVGAIGAVWDQTQGLIAIDSNEYFAVFDTLVNYGPSGETIPRLATGYEISEDRKTVTLQLRDDVDFVDGTHFDASTAETWFDFALASDQFAWSGAVAPLGAEFTATGDYTLELTAEVPFFHPNDLYYDPLRLLLGFTQVLSPAAIDDRERAKVEPMGSGPYVISDVVPDVEMTLVRNTDYWDTEAYPFDTVVLKVFTDPIASLNALKSGQVNATGLSVDQVKEAESAGFTVVGGSLSYETLLIRNPNDSTMEPLRDRRVREAIALSFDRETIAETLDAGYGRPSSQAFVERQESYVEGGDDRYTYDPDRARELMAEAGYADGFDVVMPNFEGLDRTRPIVEQSLSDIGIRIEWENFADGGAWFAAINSGQYPLVLTGNANANTLRFLIDEFTGLGHIFDQTEELQPLLDAIRYGDADEASAASDELGELILEQIYYIPFSRPTTFYATAPGIVVDVSDTIAPLLYDYHLED